MDEDRAGAEEAGGGRILPHAHIIVDALEREFEIIVRHSGVFAILIDALNDREIPTSISWIPDSAEHAADEFRARLEKGLISIEPPTGDGLLASADEATAGAAGGEPDSGE